MDISFKLLFSVALLSKAFGIVLVGLSNASLDGFLKLSMVIRVQWATKVMTRAIPRLFRMFERVITFLANCTFSQNWTFFLNNCGR